MSLPSEPTARAAIYAAAMRAINDAMHGAEATVTQEALQEHLGLDRLGTEVLIFELRALGWVSAAAGERPGHVRLTMQGLALVALAAGMGAPAAPAGGVSAPFADSKGVSTVMHEPLQPITGELSTIPTPGVSADDLPLPPLDGPRESILFMSRYPNGTFEFDCRKPRECKAFALTLPVWRVRVVERLSADGTQYWAWWENGASTPVPRDRGFEEVCRDSRTIEAFFAYGTKHEEARGRGKILPVDVEPLEEVIP